MTTFIRMLKDDSGASAAEYALILAIIGSVIAIAAIGLAQAVGGAMNRAASCISSTSTASYSANCVVGP
jgi:pilus assembly protein Flp/PilA